MKCKNSKTIISLVLLVVMLMSALPMSLISTSAAWFDPYEYKFEVSTPGSNARSNDTMFIKLYGTNGYVYHHFSLIGAETVGTTFTFKGAKDIGNLLYMTIENQHGYDDWYFDWIKVTSPSDSEIFYGGRWVQHAVPLTFRPDDNVIKLEVKTGTETYAGTDADVYFRLIDTKGNEYLTDEASSVHPSANAFEKNDGMFMYVYVDSPQFGIVDDIIPELYANGTLFSDWYLDYVQATYVSGKYEGLYKLIIFDEWIEAQ